MDQLPRLGKRELVCLLLFTCNYVVSVWRGFSFLWVLGMGYVILLWHSLSLPYNYFDGNLVSKQNSPRWDAAFCGINLKLFCLPMSHKKDARLIWVNL